MIIIKISMENEIMCPKCNSTQLTANKKGFGVGKAAAGAILTGGIGLLAGGIGSNKILITCMACGFQFKPQDRIALERQAATKSKVKEVINKKRSGQELTEDESALLKRTQTINGTATMIFVLVLFLLFKSCM